MDWELSSEVELTELESVEVTKSRLIIKAMLNFNDRSEGDDDTKNFSSAFFQSPVNKVKRLRTTSR